MVAVLVVAAVITWLRPASSDSQHVQLGGTAPATGVLPAAPTTVAAPGPTTTGVPTTTEAPGATVTATTVAGPPPEPGPAAPLATGRGYQLLWPFTSLGDALAWQADAGPGGHQPWHARAEDTALAFAAFLGVGDVDRAASSIPDVRGAHVTVGFLNPAGQPVAVAVVHLVRLGSGDAPPWEVVGTDDILGLSLDVPRYGATVSSPVAVGGRITGVDEHIVVRAHRAGRGPAGGVEPGRARRRGGCAVVVIDRLRPRPGDGDPGGRHRGAPGRRRAVRGDRGAGRLTDRSYDRRVSSAR